MSGDAVSKEYHEAREASVGDIVLRITVRANLRVFRRSRYQETALPDTPASNLGRASEMVSVSLLVLLFAVAASLASPAAQPAEESNMNGELELVLDLGILLQLQYTTDPEIKVCRI